MCVSFFFYASLAFFTYFGCLGLHHAELAPIGSVHRELGLRKYENESHSVVSDSLRPHGLYNPWNSPGQNTGVGSHSLLQESFLTQGSNPGLPHCRWILYQLSHQGSLTIKSRFLGLSLINQLPLSNLEGDLTN